jgi:hypothetical protein
MEAQLKAWDTVVEQLGQDPFFKKVRRQPESLG